MNSGSKNMEHSGGMKDEVSVGGGDSSSSSLSTNWEVEILENEVLDLEKELELSEDKLEAMAGELNKTRINLGREKKKTADLQKKLTTSELAFRTLKSEYDELVNAIIGTNEDERRQEPKVYKILPRKRPDCNRVRMSDYSGSGACDWRIRKRQGISNDRRERGTTNDMPFGGLQGHVVGCYHSVMTPYRRENGFQPQESSKQVTTESIAIPTCKETGRPKVYLSPPKFDLAFTTLAFLDN